MKVVINAPTIIGGVFYDASPIPQSVPGNVGLHLVEIGNAISYEQKIVEPEVKKEKKTSVSLQPDPALPVKTPRRRGRPRKSSS